jgi:hypothetical protein
MVRLQRQEFVEGDPAGRAGKLVRWHGATHGGRAPISAPCLG